MASKRFALEAGGPEEIEIRWGSTSFSKCSVLQAGTLVGSSPLLETLDGMSVTLADGSSLNVRLVSKRFKLTPTAMRNGEPLPGSDVAPPAKHMPQMAVGYACFMFLAAAAAGIGGLIAGVMILTGQMRTDSDPVILGVGSIVGGPIAAVACGYIAVGLFRLRSWARSAMLALIVLGLGGLIVLASVSGTVKILGLVKLGYGLYWFAANGEEFH